MALVVHRDRRPLDATEALNLTFNYPSGSRSEFGLNYIRIDDGRRARILSRMQEHESPPENLPAEEPFTLTRLRWKIARILARPNRDFRPDQEAAPTPPE